MGARILRLVCAWVVVQTFAGAARAQTEPSALDPRTAAETAEGDPSASADAAPDAPMDAAAATDATWAARIEYHRQLRSVDLSELNFGASTLGYGIYSMTRDEGFSRGMGGALIAGGSVHLVSGILFTIRSQRGMRPTVAPAEFREGDPLARELEEMEHRSELFLAYLLSDTSVITGSITTALVGIAKDKPTVQGVGLGLASQGVLTLVLDLMHQNQGRAYLRRLRDLNLRFQVDQVRSGQGAVASVGWSR